MPDPIRSASGTEPDVGTGATLAQMPAPAPALMPEPIPGSTPGPISGPMPASTPSALQAQTPMPLDTPAHMSMPTTPQLHIPVPTAEHLSAPMPSPIPTDASISMLDHVLAATGITSTEFAQLLWLSITLAAFVLGLKFQSFCRAALWANPVLAAILLVAATLAATGTPYGTYFQNVRMMHFLLGPATVALAIPLAESFSLVLRSLPAMTVALLAGAVTSMVSGVVFVMLLGGSHAVALSMAPKAVTTPIAIAITNQIGGIPSLTAAFAILGGIIAAMTGETLLRRLGITDWRAHGLAAGVSGSGIAAAQVAQRNPLGAAFAALGIGLNGLVTSILAPLMLRYFSL